MKVLITAGSTQCPIDRVRAITNIFGGRTGARIAGTFGLHEEVDVTLVTSMNRVMLNGILGERLQNINRVVQFRTYNQLRDIMQQEIERGTYDVVVHSAAVSDYKVDGVYVRNLGPNAGPSVLKELDSTGKISSDCSEMFLRLVPTEKIIDKIRKPWGFDGVLVKFKLQVGMTDTELIDVATKSMATSDADLIVANCLEWCDKKAFIIARDGSGTTVQRQHLPLDLFLAVQRERRNRS